MGKAFESIKQGLTEALGHAKGTQFCRFHRTPSSVFSVPLLPGPLRPERRPDGRWDVLDDEGRVVSGAYDTAGEAWEWIDLDVQEIEI